MLGLLDFIRAILLMFFDVKNHENWERDVKYDVNDVCALCLYPIPGEELAIKMCEWHVWICCVNLNEPVENKHNRNHQLHI